MNPFGKHAYKVCWVGKSWNQEILELDVGINGEGVVQKCLFSVVTKELTLLLWVWQILLKM